jgi:hypothetical protein
MIAPLLSDFEFSIQGIKNVLGVSLLVDFSE